MKAVAARAARHDGLPAGAITKQQRTPRGGTGASLKKLMMGKHPQHGCSLTQIKPLSSKTKMALTQTEHTLSEGENENEVEEVDLVAEVSSQMQDTSELSGAEATPKSANFQSCMVELEELEQQALRAAGMDVAPEEEDMFCELAL